VVVPYPILLESYSLALHKLGTREAHALLPEVTSTAILTNATTEDYQDSSVAILPYRDQDLTLFDTVLAAMSDRLEAPVWTFDHHFDVLRLTFGDDRGSGFPAESQIDLPEDSKNTTADFSVIDQYRMVGTDGSTEKSTRPIVHAWCVRVNINATRYSLVIPSALLQPWLRTS